MERLITRIKDNVYYSKGEYAPTTLCAEMTSSEVRECMSKLAEYEDLGMTPFEIRNFLKDFGISLSMENRELKKRSKSVKIRMVNQFDGSCPSCGELLIMGSHKYRYCYACGQLLDWSE